MKIRDLFVHHPDGSWEPKAPTTINMSRGVMDVNPGTVFRPGTLFGGVDVALLCEEDAENLASSSAVKRT